MEVKGAAVSTISDFVKTKFSNRYKEWFSALPEESRTIFTNPIYAHNWYPINSACIIPTLKATELFFDNPETGIWQLGRYSAEKGLTGVYKAFVILSSPIFMIKNATVMMGSYYRPAELKIVENTNKSFILHIIKFPFPHSVIDYRIAGWMEKALEIAKCRNLKIVISKSLSKGDSVTEFLGSWD